VTWYLGRPGALQQIRPPARDYDRTADDNPTTVELLNGRAVQRRPRALGTYTYQWNWLERPDWSVIKGVASGQYGPGPYALIDGSTANYLTPEQASGDASGFTANAGLLSTVDTPVMLGRSVAWNVAAVTTYSGLVPNDDQPDPVTFSVPAGTTRIEVWLVGDLRDPENNDLDASLINPAGTVVASSEGADSNEHMSYTGTIAAGVWKVSITAYGPATAGTYTLTVALSSPGTSGTLTAPHPSFGRYPVAAGEPYTLSMWAQSADSPTAAVAMAWYDTSGTKLSESVSSGATLSGAWERLAVTGVAPSGAVTASPELRVSGTGPMVYIGQARLAMGDTGTDWYPGEGLPAVSVTSLQESVPIHDKRTVQLTLTEVA